MPFKEPRGVFSLQFGRIKLGGDGVENPGHAPENIPVRPKAKKAVESGKGEGPGAIPGSGGRSAREMHRVTEGDTNVTPDASADMAPLLAAAAKGDGRAWGAIVAAYSRRVYALAKSRCGSAELAEEITQSVFVTVATKLGSGGYDERGKFESWLFRVAMNRVRDEARRRRRQASPSDHPGLLAVANETGPEPDEGAMMSRLREAMGRLSDADREVIELRHHGQMSFKDMSELLDEPMGTLLARHHRALRKLKRMIDGQAEEGSDE